MTELSPAAQAVLDAYRSSHLSINNLAAALETLADQWKNETREQPDTEFIAGIKNCIDALTEIAAELRAAAEQAAPFSTNLRQNQIHQRIFAIAAELEGAGAGADRRMH